MNDTQTSIAFYTMAKLPKIEGAQQVAMRKKLNRILLTPSHPTIPGAYVLNCLFDGSAMWWTKKHQSLNKMQWWLWYI